MKRVRAVLIAATLVALSLALPAPAAPMQCGSGATYDRAGLGWLLIRPEFPVGSRVVTAVAAPTFRPDVIYATNGRAVMRTDDGGCNWTTVLDVTEHLLGVAESPFPTRIVALVAPSTATSSKHVYVAVEQSFLREPPRPVVLSSADEGKSWRRTKTGPDGLPPIGRIRELAVCNLMADSAYVLVDVPEADGSPATALYQTNDGGVTWLRRTATLASFPHRGLLVNPLIPSNVFAVAPGGLQQSTNSGVTFSDLGPRGPLTQVAGAVGQSYIRLAIGHANTDYVDVSGDGGKTWAKVPTPITPAHVAVAPLRAVYAVSDYLRVAIVGPRRRPIYVTPDVDKFGDLSFGAPTPAGTSMAGVGDGGVLRGVLDLETFRPLPQRRPIRLLPEVPPTYFPPSLIPAAVDLALEAGESRDVPFTLMLPRSPSPIDVMFLVDSTGSMQPVIEGLKQSLADIVNQLSTLGLDVQFGVGDFRDVPAPHGKGPSGDAPYRLFREIGPADEELQDAIADMVAGGGNAETAALIAAHQATTGSGWRALDDELVVDPGEDAKFRPDTLRLLVVATDIGMAQGGNYPTIEATAAVLRKHNARAVGLAISTTAVEDESELARQTNALAPVGGLDCDGDGRIDLEEGDPLVCNAPMQSVRIGTGPPVRLAPAVVALTERATDLRVVRATVAGDPARATVTQGAVHPAVNLKADNELPFTVRFTCPTAPKPSRYAFTLNAAPPGRPGGSSSATLTCGPAPVKKKVKVPEELAPLPAAVPVAAAAAPGAPPPNPVPNPNVNPNPNPNPGLNGNVGMADQREEEFQLALAENEDEGAPGTLPGQSLAMSSRREADPALLLGPAALLVASATWVARRRTAPRVAPVRADRRRRR